MIYKNTASQKIAVFAYTASTGAAKTGDAAQITSYLSIDWGSTAAVADTNPTELDATNMPGWYVFDLTQAETNGNVLVFAPKSSTSGVVVDQVQVFTTASIDQTGDSYAIVNNGTYGNAAIENLVDDIGAAGAGLTAIPWNAAWDAEVQSEAADALVAYDPPTNAELEARTLVAANYFDPAADAVATVTTVNGLAAGAITAAAIATNAIDADALAADAVTEIQSGLATAASIAALNNLSAAQVNSEVVDAIQTDILPDSVPADGSRGSLGQYAYMILQILTEAAVSGTTMTIKKPDGSTTLLTITLDDGTTPTSKTRSG